MICRLCKDIAYSPVWSLVSKVKTDLERQNQPENSGVLSAGHLFENIKEIELFILHGVYNVSQMQNVTIILGALV